MPSRGDLQWHQIADFSPGIFTNTNNGPGASTPAPPGAATSNTYRCKALPNGGLGPLPRRTENITLPELPSYVAAIYRISGFNAELSFTIAVPAADTDNNNRVELHYSFEHPVAADKVHQWLRQRVFNTVTPGWDTIKTTTELGTGAQAGRYASIFHTRMNPTTPTDFGQTVTILVWAGQNPLVGPRVSHAFPDPATPTTNSTLAVGDPASHAYLLAGPHQGRTILNRLLAYSRGVTAAYLVTDNWYWTDVNDNSLAAIASAFVFENPQSITDFASMTANELAVVKSHDGGFMVQGDVDSPIVIQLPNLQSPDGTATVKGCRSRIGFVYSAGEHGIWAWNGGDGAEPISAQLDAGFCIPSTIGQSGHQGQMAQWGEAIVAPMNWLYDTRMKSWWRLEDPTLLEVAYFSQSAYRGYLYGCYHTIDNSAGAGNRQVVWKWDPTTAAYSYRWESQPLSFSINRLVNIREVEIDLTGTTQNLTVTFLDDTGTTSVHGPVVVNSASHPTKVRFNVGFNNKRNVRVRVDLDGSAGSNPAAVIGDINVGWAEREHSPVAV